ncbi:MAG: DUF2490 domain-containing protein [Bacteroidia bacterium]
MKRITIILLSLSIGFTAIAQTGTSYTIQDFETWSSITLSYKANKKLKLSLNEQLRLKDNSGTVDEYFTQLEGSYKLTKGLSFGLGLRFIKENDNQGKVQGYENHFRWNTDLEYKHDINRFEVKYRARYQSKKEQDTEDLSNTNFRFKVGTTYNIKKWKLDPTISSEIFNGISSNEGFNKIRFTVGTKYETKKIGNFGVFYRMQKDLIGAYPKTTNIGGFKYEYTIKRK